MKLVIELPPTRLAAAPKRNPFFTQNSQSMKRAFVNEGVEQAWAGGRSHKQVPGIKRNSPVWKFDCTGFFFFEGGDRFRHFNDVPFCGGWWQQHQGGDVEKPVKWSAILFLRGGLTLWALEGNVEGMKVRGNSTWKWEIYSLQLRMNFVGSSRCGRLLYCTY